MLINGGCWPVLLPLGLTPPHPTSPHKVALLVHTFASRCFSHNSPGEVTTGLIPPHRQEPPTGEQVPECLAAVPRRMSSWDEDSITLLSLKKKNHKERVCRWQGQVKQDAPFSPPLCREELLCAVSLSSSHLWVTSSFRIAP